MHCREREAWCRAAWSKAARHQSLVKSNRCQFWFGVSSSSQRSPRLEWLNPPKRQRQRQSEPARTPPNPDPTLPDGTSSEGDVFTVSPFHPFKRVDLAFYLETKRKLSAMRKDICGIQSVMLSIRSLPLRSECSEMKYASA